MHLFITGTDTEVGKTYFSAWLVRQWRKRGHNAVGIKPISCGGTEDAEMLQQAAEDVLSLQEVNPVQFPSPVAPGVAEKIDAIPLDWPAVEASVAAARIRFSHVAVEGVGGWLVPLDDEKLVRDWAVELQLPVLVVARAGLGTINHTLLTVESIQETGLPVLGVVLNAGMPDSSIKAYPQAFQTNAETLRELLSVPIFYFDSYAEKVGDLPEWLQG